MRVRFPAWIVSGLAVAVLATPLAAGPPQPAPPARGMTPELLAAIPARYQQAVARIVAEPTVTARSAETPFLARPQDYDFLLDHPDRACLAWRRLQVPCVLIEPAPDQSFLWSDDNGNHVTWRAVARFRDGIVWLATGQLKPGSLFPTVPIEAVAVLRAPRTTLKSVPGQATLEPSATVYLLTDSRAAKTFLRIAGPAAPRLAEQGAEQLLLFFSGPTRYARQNPDQAAELFAPAAADRAPE